MAGSREASGYTLGLAQTFVAEFPRPTAMPIYAYRCQDCGFEKDQLQKLSDAPLTVCPSCAGNGFARKLTAPAFQLKGSGWYVTDFRDGGQKKGAEGGAAGDQAAGDKPADKPAGGDAGAAGGAAKSDGSAATAPAASKPAESGATAAPASASASSGSAASSTSSGASA